MTKQKLWELIEAYRTSGGSEEHHARKERLDAVLDEICKALRSPVMVASPQPAQHPKAKAIAECLAVLRPAVNGKFPHEQALEELVGYIAAPQPAQQEPVGKAYLCDRCSTPFDGDDECPKCGHGSATKKPVYTSPPAQRKPLTDEEQIAEALRRHSLTLVKTAKGYDVMSLGHITAHSIKE